MNFENALIEFKNGKKIKRQCWGKKEYIYYDGITITSDDGTEYILDIDDIFANDWCVYS